MRSSSLIRRTPLRRITRLNARSRTNRRRPAYTPYMNWIRTLPCILCGGAHGKSEAAHTNVFGSSGMAQKTSNRTVIPLCWWCHKEGPDSYHRMTPERTWSEYHNIDLPALVLYLNMTFDSRRANR